MATLNGITSVNIGYGICGFCAAICGMCHLHPATNQAVGMAPAADRYVYDVVVDFMNNIHGTYHWDAIQAFTRSFPGHANFDINAYWLQVQQGWLAMQQPGGGEIWVGLAMTPGAMTELLWSRWGVQRDVVLGGLPGGNPSGHIVGLVGIAGGMYHGLAHWVYCDGTEHVHNHGQYVPFDSLLGQFNGVSCSIRLS